MCFSLFEFGAYGWADDLFLFFSVYLAPLSGVPLGTVTHVAGLLVDGRPDRIAVTFGDDVVLELAPVAPLALARPATHRTLITLISFVFACGIGFDGLCS